MPTKTAKKKEVFDLVSVQMAWHDRPKESIDTLCAIGRFDENNTKCLDWDDAIFYWFGDLKELKSAMKKGKNGFEFRVLEYRMKKWK